MKAPASAEFAKLSDMTLRNQGPNETIVGDVDAETRSAPIRNSFSCEVFVASNGSALNSAVFSRD